MATVPETTFPVLEQTTNLFTAVITDNDGVTPMAVSRLTAFTLTTYIVRADGQTQILRDHQACINASNVVVNALGEVIWTIQPSDTMVIEDVPFERHYALFEWYWANGNGKFLITLVVENLALVA